MGTSGVTKPKPLKVFGRTHYACTRCKLSKIRCSGEKPACANCKSVNKEDACVYPNRDRKIVIMESDLNKLHERVQYLESLTNQPPSLGPDPAYNLHLNPPAGPPTGPPSTANVLPQGFVQDRIVGHTNGDFLGGGYTEESYLLSDFENDPVQFKLLSLCGSKLPERDYTLKLINKVYNTYSSEFYLIDLREIHVLVHDVYHLFDKYHSSEMKSWVQDFSRRIPSISLCYLLIIIAFGEQLYNVSTTAPTTPSLPQVVPKRKQKIPGIDYYLLAVQLFHLTQEELTLQFIQSAVFLALYSANLNRYNTVYNYFGVAVRSAVANGFHRQQDSPATSDENEKLARRIRDEKAKRLWWSVFVIDTTWAAKMNMPVHIEYTDTDVDLPIENGKVDLGDSFNSEILEVNVHLTKYVASFIRLIYGPNIRTFSINYINTDQFNQKLLIKNIIQCLDDLITNFETPLLTPYKSANVMEVNERKIANLFLRYHQLVILITKPLLMLIFSLTSSSSIDNIREVEAGISKGLLAASSTIDIILKFYECNKLFVLGFWDSQHLFNALMLTIMASSTSQNRLQIHSAVALLAFMADNNNINAQNCMKKLIFVNDVIVKIPELDLRLNLDSDIQQFIRKRTVDEHHEPEPFFNPFTRDVEVKQRIDDSIFNSTRINQFTAESRTLMYSFINTAQSWDTFRGLPIHIYGTERSKLHFKDSSLLTNDSSQKFHKKVPSLADSKLGINQII